MLRFPLRCGLAAWLLLSVAVLMGCGGEDKKAASNTLNAQVNDTPGQQVAKTTDGGTDAAKPAPGASEDTKPSQPKPTIYSAMELAKVMDFTKLPLMEGAKSGRNNSANFQAKVPAKVPDVAEFYLTKLAALGWKLDTEQSSNKITDEYASAKLSKDGHVAYMSISRTSDKPDDKPESWVQFWFQGNFDTRTLPRSEGAKLTYGSQTSSIYTTPNKVADEADLVAKALVADGWQAFGRFNSSKTEQPDQRSWTYRKQGYVLDIFIVVAPAQGNQTNVQYSVRALAHELPAPPGATQVEFDDEMWEMKCEVPGDLQTVAEYYRKAMPAAGYKTLSSEDPRETYINLRFGTEADDIVLVQVASKDGKSTKVHAIGTSAGVLAEMRKREEKQIQEAKQKLEEKNKKQAVEKTPKEKALIVQDVPLPKEAKQVKYDAAGEQIVFQSSGNLEALAKEMREQLTAAGWQENPTFSVVNKNVGSFQFKQGAASIQITLVNTGLGDGTKATIKVKGMEWQKTEK